MKNPLARLLLAFSFFQLIALPLFAQDDWVRIVSPKGDFSVDIPGSEWIVDKEVYPTRIFRNAGDRWVTIGVRSSSSAKDEFRKDAAFYRTGDGYEFYEGGDFLIRRYNGKSRDDEDGTEADRAHVSFTFASSKGEYSVSIGAPEAGDEFYNRVLGSIRLNKAPFLKSQSLSPEPLKTVEVEELKTDDRIIKALGVPDSTQPLPLPGSDDEYSSKNKAKYSRSLIVIKKVKARYTVGARNKRISGMVRLLVTFSANGQLGPIKLVKSLEKGLDKAAFEAVRKMKFLPAEIDGKPVDTVRPVVFTFNIY